MAFEHHAHQRAVALQALLENIGEHMRLAQWVLAAVGVAAVDHDPRRYGRLGQVVMNLGNVLALVVWPAVPTPQYQVGVRVALGFDDRRVPLGIDAEVAVRVSGAAHGVAGDADAAVGAVLEAHRHIQAAGHFPVDLRFGGARTDGNPAQQVVEVAGRHRLQQLGGDGQAKLEHFAHQLARQGQAADHVVAAIQARIVGQAFPADCGTRFFHVSAHHQQQLITDIAGQFGQAAGVFERRLWVMDGARPDYYQQA
ncbi:hypothetical protein D9M71_284480 [compost metagenome]